MGMIRFFTLLITFSIAACSGSGGGSPGQKMLTRQPTVAVARAARASLSQTEAQRRSDSIDQLSYRLEIQLEQSDSHFSGQVAIVFNYQPNGLPLTIDFSAGEVLGLQINGFDQRFDYNGNFIELPPTALQAGHNSISIAFRHPYSRDGKGLYRYQDPLDQRVYLYSDFEPWGANRLFPHFDQPDLKARFTLAVTAPREWSVISTTRESGSEDRGPVRYWTFPETLPMSSYLFSLHAGPYAQWGDSDFRYPLRLFARQSLATHVESGLWLDYSRAGFNFFEQYFDFEYPFGKYDQVIVPDYNSGAMENIAAVSYSEDYVFRSELTREERKDIAEVIFHEMAHMWFGNISTMAWWNGLWLNESFASLMAYLALLEQAEFGDAWHSFFLSYKLWAYAEDELVTTHPIELEVPTTAAAEIIFDGITYGKGAAVLKQLNARLGADTFRRGVRSYLHDNAFASTELEDFTGSLGQAAGQDLRAWSQDWLYRAGTNSVQAQLRCRRGRIQSLLLQQTAPEEHPYLREQQLDLALYRLQGGKLELQRRLPVLLSGKTTSLEQLRGQPCPALVYPNYQDWGYIKVLLDSRSRNIIRHHINSLADPLQRSMLWEDLWGMVKRAELSLAEFLQIAEANLGTERNLIVADNILGSVASAYAYLQQIPNGDEELQRSARVLQRMLRSRLLTSSGDAQKMWLDAYVTTASNAQAWQLLGRMLRGELQVPGLTLDQDRRWNMVVKLREFAVAGSTDMMHAEQQRDDSASGRRRLLQARVIGAGPAAKAAFMQQAIRHDENYQLDRSRTILRSLYPPGQRYQMPAADMLAALPALDRSQDIVFHRYLAASLLPRLCTPENVLALATALADNPRFNPALIRSLRISHQLEQRCVSIAARLYDHAPH